MKRGVNRSQKSSICVDFHHQWQFSFNEDLCLHHKAWVEAKTQNLCLEFLYTHVSVCSVAENSLNILANKNKQNIPFINNLKKSSIGQTFVQSQKSRRFLVYCSKFTVQMSREPILWLQVLQNLHSWFRTQSIILYIIGKKSLES